jgi:hypothetical protein
VAVLVVTHAGDQVLHELHLVCLRPLVKQDDAVLLVLVIVALRRPLAGARHRPVTDLGEQRGGTRGKASAGRNVVEALNNNTLIQG